MTRRPLDAYYTPTHLTELLLGEMPGLRSMLICEPCVGDGAIASCFDTGYIFDIDPVICAGICATQADARTHVYPGNIEAFVTNPPFSCAYEIVRNLVENQPLGVPVVCLLRLTFLEPTYERGPWLERCPPNLVYVCPRTSFTGDGKTDSATVAWMIWLPDGEPGGIHVFAKPPREKIPCQTKT